VRGGAAPDPDLVRQREVVEAFLAALRGGDFEGLLAVLDPDLVVRADISGAPTEVRGAALWAKGAVAYGHLARLTQPALVNGAIGVVVAPQGRLVRALRFTIANGKITEIEVIGDVARLGELDVRSSTEICRWLSKPLETDQVARPRGRRARRQGVPRLTNEFGGRSIRSPFQRACDTANGRGVHAMPVHSRSVPSQDYRRRSLLCSSCRRLPAVVSDCTISEPCWASDSVLPMPMEVYRDDGA
jgi:hypothetical protein